MGRAKLNMELIPKEKTRLTTFKKRKQGLIRKMHEFTTLCDVSACMIIYGPNQESGHTEPETWPTEREDVKKVIDGYRAKNKDSGSKTYGLHDFYLDRKRKIEDELTKMKKKNMEAKYPTWLDGMNGSSEAELRGFAANLLVKAERVRARVEQMRRNKQGQLITMDMIGDYYNNAAPPLGMQTNYYPLIDQHQHHPNSMMMLLMNGEYNNSVNNNLDQSNFNNNCVNYQCGAPPPQPYDQRCIYYDPSDPRAMWDGQPMQYYGPGPQPIQYGPGPELQFFKTENNQFFKAENNQFFKAENDDSGDQESVNGGQCDQVNFNNKHLERFRG